MSDLGPAFRLPPPRKPRCTICRSSALIAAVIGLFLWALCGYIVYLIVTAVG